MANIETADKKTMAARGKAIAELSEEAKAKRNAYQKEWRRNNPEKVKASLIKYWNRKAKEGAIETPEDFASISTKDLLKEGNTDGKET